MVAVVAMVGHAQNNHTGDQTMSDPLSPAAVEAVLDAAIDAWRTRDDGPSIGAATLRAFADQAVPECECPVTSDIRAKLLACADQLAANHR